MIQLNQLIKKYKKFIELKFPQYYKNFCKIEKNNPVSARAQAVVHNLLESNRVHVEIYEDPSTGGADFLCETFGNNFLVEVTSVDSKTVANKSNIPDNIPNEIKARTFSQITLLLQRKASAKTGQLADENYPRVLAITSEHIANGVLFGNFSVKEFMTGVTQISVDLTSSKSQHQEITELQASAFLRRDSQRNIKLCRKSISAIMLVQVNNDSCGTYGLLHPQPIVEFRYELLPNIPFLRINPWPIENNKIFCEWIINNPEPFTSYYHSFKT